MDANPESASTAPSQRQGQDGVTKISQRDIAPSQFLICLLYSRLPSTLGFPQLSAPFTSLFRLIILTTSRNYSQRAT